MLALLLIVALVLAVGLAPWFVLLAAVLLAATYRRLRERPADPGAPTPAGSRFLVVVPAHDEEGVIGVTVASCRALDYPADRVQVFVIADNCGDETAAVAREAGAEVVVRTDPARKSKGFALEDFFAGVAGNPAVRPFDAYVLVDADTSVAPDLLHAFDRSLAGGADFVQGYYTVRNADASWRTRLMTYAFSLANGVWLLGTDQLGLSVGLKGNGMCFRAAALRDYPWRVHGLVEDMEYAWAIRLAGGRVRFEPRARVFGEMVSRGGAGATSQRRRWEDGRRSLRRSVRTNLWRSPRLGPARKLAYQVELSFPPLSRLVAWLTLGTTLAVCGAWASRGQVGWAVVLAVFLAQWAALIGYLISPLALMRLPASYLMSLMHVPYYMLWKLGTGFGRKTQQWIRTPREVVDGEA